MPSLISCLQCRVHLRVSHVFRGCRIRPQPCQDCESAGESVGVEWDYSILMPLLDRHDKSPHATCGPRISYLWRCCKSFK
jgi:hypothetical protein